ncbi:uncharacterized protein LOC143426472 [Xylocopa sonorina]|uniref:uncharacterized protein LOC143426472 n=1 Tax=Xylocopa sonorina TaxID=1818115 RepID=UPI00403ADD69
MSKFRFQYKKKSSGFGDIAENRFIRAKKYEETRRNQRAANFNENRNISNSSQRIQKEEVQPVPAPAPKNRSNKLLAWKAERERRKKLEENKKKPAFVVGVVHHKIYSPVIGSTSIAPVVKTDSIPKRITKATEKRLTIKTKKNEVNTNASRRNPIKTSKKENIEKKHEQLSVPADSKGNESQKTQTLLFGTVSNTISGIEDTSNSSKVERSKTSNESDNKEDNTKKVDIPLNDTSYVINDAEDTSEEDCSFKLSFDEKETFSSSNDSESKTKADNNKVFNNSITEANFSLKNNKSISTSTNSSCEPAFFSPYVVSRRGKDNARKEQQLKRGFSIGHSPIDNIPMKDTVMKSLNISVEDEERTAQYFQFLLNKEVERLNELCEKWLKIKADPETTEDGQYEINQAIGQTNLLISKKFERFRGLVADCETGKGEMLVTCKDLQGFWDMMYMEVKNCNLRFEKLEKLRSQGWKEDEVPLNKPVTRNKCNTKKNIAPTRTSCLRTFLAGKKKKQMEKMENNDIKVFVPKSNYITSSTYSASKTPLVKYGRNSMGSVDRNTNKSASTKYDKRRSLLQNIQLSQNPKKMSSPLTIMKISQLCKTPVVLLDDSISYINSNQTPAKSILKQSKSSTESESRGKSSNKVNFDDYITLSEVPIDEETQTKLDLAAALTRIDNLDLDNPDDSPIKAEKKLYFDDSSDECENSIKQKSILKNSTNKIMSDEMQMEIPLQESNKNVNTPIRKNIRRQNAVDVDEEILDLPAPFIKVTSSTPHNKLKKDNNLNTSKEEHVSINEKVVSNEYDESIRVLRNRIITPTSKPKTRRSRKSVSVQEPEHKENKISSERRPRRSAIKVNINVKEGTNLHSSANNTEGNISRRRSTRSIKFSEEEYSDAMDKPTLPMTPHIRRSKIHFNQEESTAVADMSNSFKELETPPVRVRRSRMRKV